MKKRIIIICAISILCVGIVFAFILWKQKTATTPPELVATPTSVPQELVLWEDQAGFSFSHPKELLFDKHDEDQDNYAHIEFTSATHSGRLIVWAKDTTYTDVSSWVTKDKELQDSASVDTTLGGEPAKKILITTPSKKSIIGAISDQILFTIEAEPTEGDSYWTTVSDTILSSFVFTPLDTSDTDTAASEDAGPAVDEEEVVE
jgi:hypothetical protein